MLFFLILIEYRVRICAKILIGIYVLKIITDINWNLLTEDN